MVPFYLHVKTTLGVFVLISFEKCWEYSKAMRSIWSNSDSKGPREKPFGKYLAVHILLHFEKAWEGLGEDGRFIVNMVYH